MQATNGIPNIPLSFFASIPVPNTNNVYHLPTLMTNTTTMQQYVPIQSPETPAREKTLWSKAAPLVPHEIMRVADRNFNIASLQTPVTLKRRDPNDNRDITDAEIEDEIIVKPNDKNDKGKKASPSPGPPKVKADGTEVEKFDASRVAPMGRAVISRQNRFQRRTREYDANDERRFAERFKERDEAMPWILSGANADPAAELTGTADGDQDAVYWLLYERADGFEVVPADKFYKFVAKPKYETKDYETAELEFAKGLGSSVSKNRNNNITKLMAKKFEEDDKLTPEQLADIERLKMNRFTVLKDADRVVYSGLKGLNVKQSKREEDEEDDHLEFDSSPFEDDGNEDLGQEIDEQDRKEMDKRTKADQRKATNAWKELVDDEIEEEDYDAPKRFGASNTSKSLKKRLKQTSAQTGLSWDAYGSEGSDETEDDDEEDESPKSNSRKEEFKPILGRGLKSAQKKSSKSPSPSSSRESSLDLKVGTKMTIKMKETRSSISPPPGKLKRGRKGQDNEDSAAKRARSSTPIEHPPAPTWQEVLKQQTISKKQASGSGRATSADPSLLQQSQQQQQRPTGVRHVSPPRPLPSNHPQVIAAAAAAANNTTSANTPITLKRSSTPSSSVPPNEPPSKRVKHVASSSLSPPPPHAMSSGGSSVASRPPTPASALKQGGSSSGSGNGAVKSSPGRPAATSVSTLAKSPACTFLGSLPPPPDGALITQEHVLAAARELGNDVTVRALVNALRPLMQRNEDQNKEVLRGFVKTLFNHVKDGKIELKPQYVLNGNTAGGGAGLK
ncbi:hypothetical protein SmJEL517_g00805 [Synchytrium microbalum]|uniref:Transcription initiation factor IIF subunit alpha n=1 Tax=Synchytrium microbalum TaxID=1806994 RepID=A0A507C7L2_9FUNG|nr:uncharacterized protein SmJEL517_g00805 [Synchytrium microbalum]TPX37037.1 hypothetical protein SmJEL517_g00805 [Synchytrium microbalum]